MAAGDVEVNVTTNNSRAGASFDGVDDKLTRTPLTNISVTKAFSVSFWVHVNDTNTQQTLAVNGNGASDRFAIEIQSDEIQASCYNGSDWKGEASCAFTYNTWTNIIYTHNGDDTAVVYINGVAPAQGVNHPSTATSTFTIGANAAGGVVLNGSIGNFLIYNKVLSSGEIAKVSTNQLMTNGLVHKYKLNEDYKDSVGDADLTNTGSIITISDDAIAAAIKADRTTANDKYLMVGMPGGQVVSAVIEEAA